MVEETAGMVIDWSREGKTGWRLNLHHGRAA